MTFHFFCPPLQQLKCRPSVHLGCFCPLQVGKWRRPVLFSTLGHSSVHRRGAQESFGKKECAEGKMCLPRLLASCMLGSGRSKALSLSHCALNQHEQACGAYYELPQWFDQVIFFLKGEKAQTPFMNDSILGYIIFLLNYENIEMLRFEMQ